MQPAVSTLPERKNSDFKLIASSDTLQARMISAKLLMITTRFFRLFVVSAPRWEGVVCFADTLNLYKFSSPLSNSINLLMCRRKS